MPVPGAGGRRAIGSAPVATWAASAVLALVTAAVFWRSTGFEFLLLDDPQYVSDNPVVKRGLTLAGLAWAFNVGHAGNWHPLTWISHMLDVSLFGLDPRGHHRTSVFLHAANAALVLLLLSRLVARRPGADRRLALASGLFVAACFALHPCRIESVAWVSERKDVLSSLFGLLALLAYVRYAERPGIGRYAVVFGALAAGLAAKPMLVTWPLLFLLLDAWPLGRLGPPRTVAVVAEKLPFLALSVASSALTLVAQRTAGAVTALGELTPQGRLATAAVAYAAYVRDALSPARRIAFYPMPPDARWPTSVLLASVVTLALLTGLALWAARRRPQSAVGWAWFCLGLLPVIGIVHVGTQARADRYTYLTHIGLTVAILPSIAAWRRAPAWARRAAAVGATALVLALAVSTVRQLPPWHDTIALFRRAVEVAPDNYFAHDALAIALHDEGAIEAALVHAEAAVRLNFARTEAHLRLAGLLGELGRHHEAVFHLEDAVQHRPGMAPAYFLLGIQYFAIARYREAAAAFEESTRLESGRAEAWSNLGLCRQVLGDPTAAEAAWERALALDPSSIEARTGLASVLAGRGEIARALTLAREAARADPNNLVAKHLVERLAPTSSPTVESSQ